MQPFAQDEKRSGSRRFLLLTVIAAAFGVWFFDLLPEFRPVESGRLSELPDANAPELPESWDAIVNHAAADGPASESIEETDPLLAAIEDPDDPLSSVLTELSEPDPLSSNSLLQATLPESQAGPESRSGESRVRQLSFRAPESLNDPGVVRADHVEEGPPVLPAEAAALLRNAEEFQRQDRIVDAHGELSRLYWKYPEQRSLILRRIEISAAQIFGDPHRHFGRPYLVMPGDTLESIGRQYNVPWSWLARLNRLAPEDLQAGQELKVLQGPFSAVVDLHRFELTIHAHGYFVQRYEIGIGRDSRTPVGDFTVQDKIENPSWTNPDGGGIVDRDDPQNPLGEYWIGLGDGIGIHGTIDPDSIGSARSRGCVHMQDRDIEEVFSMLGEGSPVRIRE